MTKDALLMLLPLSLFAAGAVPLLYFVPPKGKKKRLVDRFDAIFPVLSC